MKAKKNIDIPIKVVPNKKPTTTKIIVTEGDKIEIDANENERIEEASFVHGLHIFSVVAISIL